MGQVKVKIAGNEIDNVTNVAFVVGVSKAADMHPVDARPRIEGISISRRSDNKSDWWKWASKPYASNFKDGSIEYLDPAQENKTMKTVKWQGGWVSGYTETVPHIQDAKDEPMTETVTICVRVLDIDGSKIEVPWKA